MTPAAVEALVEAHEGEVADEEDAGTFVLMVDTNGDPQQESMCREVFGIEP